MDPNDPWMLIGAVLHELMEDTEAVLQLARALNAQATQPGSGNAPQKLQETAALSKSAALALLLAAANVVGATERLAVIATLVEDGEPGAGTGLS